MPSIVILSGGAVAVDLSSRDFEAFRNDVLAEGGLADLYTTRWTDRSELDMGVALTEVFAFMADNLAYYQDRCGNEALYPSAVQRRSVIEHTALLGYDLRPTVSALVELSIVTNDIGVIPAGNQVKTSSESGESPQTFELAQEFESTGSGTYTGVIAYHGLTVNEVIGSSEGTPAQFFELSSSPLSVNPLGTSSLEIWVNESGSPEAWLQVSSFLDSEPADKHFVVIIEEDDTITVYFGDGINGKIPAVGVNNMQAIYRVGGGTIGNEVGEGKVVELVGNYQFVDSITNPDKPSGGMEKESIEEAKEMAPASLRSMDRALSHLDYAVVSKRVPGVRTAYAKVGEGRFIEDLVVAAQGFNPVPTGSWDPYTETGSGLIGAVGKYVTDRANTPVILNVIPAQPVDLNMVMTVYLFNNYRKVDVVKAIEDDVRVQFDINIRDFEDQLPLSAAYDVVEDVQGVDYVDLDRFQREPYAIQVNTSSPIPCDISISSFHTTEDTENDEWSIRFMDSTTFRVVSRNRGTQVASGSLDTEYSSDDGTFKFTIFSGVVAPTEVEEWQLVTGAYKVNGDPTGPELFRLKDNEFMLKVVGGLDN